MSVQYTNRLGDTYHLREGKTKAGKTHYFFTRRKVGKAPERIPEPYEIYEHPATAQVFLRKKRPQLITDLERKRVEKQIASLERPRRYLVDVKGAFLEIYESSGNTDELSNFFGVAALKGKLAAVSKTLDRDYTAVLRFELVDKEARLFTAERFCFLGSIEDWIFLDGPDELDKLARRFIGMLGTEELYESF